MTNASRPIYQMKTNRSEMLNLQLEKKKTMFVNVLCSNK